jgi:osmoprotectant transport system substrate-binding protein
LVGEPESPVWRDAASAYAHVSRADAKVNQIIWLAPAPANNAWSIALKRDVVDVNDLESLDDLARWLNAGENNFKLVASNEFVKRPDALQAMELSHGFRLRPEQLVVLEGGDTSIMIQAAGQGTKGINAAMVYGTDDAILSAFDLVMLADSKNSQIVYQPTPTIREAVLTAKPRIKDVLDPVFRSLTTQNLKKLNARVTLENLDAKRVAIDYLKEQGFIK